MGKSTWNPIQWFLKYIAGPVDYAATIETNASIVNDLVHQRLHQDQLFGKSMQGFSGIAGAAACGLYFIYNSREKFKEQKKNSQISKYIIIYFEAKLQLINLTVDIKDKEAYLLYLRYFNPNLKNNGWYKFTYLYRRFIYKREYKKNNFYKSNKELEKGLNEIISQVDKYLTETFSKNSYSEALYERAYQEWKPQKKEKSFFVNLVSNGFSKLSKGSYIFWIIFFVCNVVLGSFLAPLIAPTTIAIAITFTMLAAWFLIDGCKFVYNKFIRSESQKEELQRIQEEEERKAFQEYIFDAMAENSLREIKENNLFQKILLKLDDLNRSGDEEIKSYIGEEKYLRYLKGLISKESNVLVGLNLAPSALEEFKNFEAIFDRYLELEEQLKPNDSIIQEFKALTDKHEEIKKENRKTLQNSHEWFYVERCEEFIYAFFEIQFIGWLITTLLGVVFVATFILPVVIAIGLGIQLLVGIGYGLNKANIRNKECSKELDKIKESCQKYGLIPVDEKDPSWKKYKKNTEIIKAFENEMRCLTGLEINNNDTKNEWEALQNLLKGHFENENFKNSKIEKIVSALIRFIGGMGTGILILKLTGKPIGFIFIVTFGFSCAAVPHVLCVGILVACFFVVALLFASWISLKSSHQSNNKNLINAINSAKQQETLLKIKIQESKIRISEIIKGEKIQEIFGDEIKKISDLLGNLDFDLSVAVDTGQEKKTNFNSYPLELDSQKSVSNTLTQVEAYVSSLASRADRADLPEPPRQGDNHILPAVGQGPTPPNETGAPKVDKSSFKAKFMFFTPNDTGVTSNPEANFSFEI